MRDSTTPQLPIVVGIDGSQAAIQAAEWAVEEAVSREVPLRLVEVISQQAAPAPVASVGNVRMEIEYAQTALRIAAAAVAAWAQRYPNVEFHALATRTGNGDLVDESGRRIQLAVISGAEVDQITSLVGPHSHPTLGHADCSVLVVRH